MESPVPARSMPPPPPPKPHKSPILNGGGADKGHIYTNNNNNNNNNGPILPQNGKSSLTAPFGASNPSVPPEDEQVVMTPRGKTANSTVLLIERKLVQQVGDRTHVAGGDHRGIIINKDTSTDPKQERPPAQLSLEFRVFLVSANTGQHSQESRKLRFWFREWIQEGDVQAHVAQDFFRELVSPKEFPRDYVGFIKKIMKQLQKGYNEIQAVEVELRILEQTSAPPSRPPRPGHVIFCYGNCNKTLHSPSRSCSKVLVSSGEDDGGGGDGHSIHPSPVHPPPATEPESIPPTGEVMMKHLWLEMYNNSLTQRDVVGVRF